MQTATAQKLGFSSQLAYVEVLRNVENFLINKATVVVNLGTADAFVGAEQLSALPGFSSTILINARVTGEFLVLLTLENVREQEKVARDLGWLDFYGGEGKPVLLKSDQEEIGTLSLNLSNVFHHAEAEGPESKFMLRANLWFSPAGTDCGIHNEHDFIEIHTQISGFGRMQKFSARDHGGLYEEQLLSPGATNPVPFCVESDTSFVYPWHQYRADTDCIWLALEYHRI